jgi:hypothetical protein
MNSTDSQNIAAREVPENECLAVLPRHFGRDMLRVEDAIFGFMRTLSPSYTGGHWVFISLSNGGMYMRPTGADRFPIRVHTNDYGGEMSADAAGITACLFALSHLSFHSTNDTIAAHFHYLREFAIGHPEAVAILAAID